MPGKASWELGLGTGCILKSFDHPPGLAVVGTLANEPQISWTRGGSAGRNQTSRLIEITDGVEPEAQYPRGCVRLGRDKIVAYIPGRSRCVRLEDKTVIDRGVNRFAPDENIA